MQLLYSPRSLTLINEIPPYGFSKSSSLLGQVFRLSFDVKCPQARRFRAIDVGPHASVGERLRVKAAETTPSDAAQKDPNVVFVAGATGRVGSRTVRELLKLGSKVRAGVRSAQRAESLVQSVKQLKLDANASDLSPPIERLEIVECDLEKNDQIGPALGNASTVICSIGASEKEVFDVTGPYRIDYLATKNLIDAATSAKVDHFILVTSLGTNKFGFPAAILNLFWGVLCWKRKAEEALLASGLPYTIVRPGGMERPTDAFKETHNVTVSQADTLFGGLVSNLQVAEFLAFMAKNRDLSYCKVVEVIAETTAPLTPMGDLLLKIPSERAPVSTSLEKDAAVEPTSDVPTSLTSETLSVDENVSKQTKATASTPLSPYTAYEDLKPPTSPTPTSSTGSVAPKGSDAGPTPSGDASPSTVKVHASSPYTSYEELKPPTSPTPTPSTGNGVPKGSGADPSPTVKINSSPDSSNDLKPPTTPSPDIAASEGSASDTVPPAKVHYSSPYINYPDLKPPTSPTPNPPALGTKSEEPPAPSADALVNGDKYNGSITTPLSPYTMYEDMKPPSSPMPSPPKNI